jgi:hypothetical protein
MRKSYGMEYFIIIAAMTATLSVPVFANSILIATSSNTENAAPQSSTVKSLGTISTDEVMGVTPAPKMASSNDASDQPFQAVQINGITYITGGIGDEERQELESTKHNYNLHITSASSDGAYVGNAHIVIHDGKGNELLDVQSGPIFYAQLPAGKYTVEERRENNIQKKRILVGHNDSSLHFSWK